MNGAIPNVYGAIVAKQKLDEELCKVLAFLVPNSGEGQQPVSEPASAFIAARMVVARRHLEQFEAALKGGAA